MARRISVTIVGDADKLNRSFREASHSAQGFGKSVSFGLSSLLKIAAAVAVIDKLREAVHLGTEEFADHSKVAAQTAAAIKSTGNVAAVSAKQIDGLALKLSNLSGIDDEVVQAGENVLLSFTKIRNQAGKGNDIFTEATKAATDWASRTGKDLPTAALLLGKALEDPARKAASLARAGIVFTQAQLKQIKAWEAGGNILKAQKFILAGLEQRFGGAAKAAGQTLPGQLNVLRDRFKDLVGSGIGLVAPAVAKAVSGLTGFVRRISEAKGFHAKLAIVWEGIQAAAQNVWELLGRALRGLTANLSAKLAVVWTGISTAGRKAQDALRKAIAKVDWNKVWASANKISVGLQKRLQAVNWNGIGKSIGRGLTTAVKHALQGAKAISEQLGKIVQSIDWVKLGKAMGPGLAAAVATAFVTLTDPSFWIHNWDLALAIGFVAFGGAIGKVAGKLAAPFARLGTDMVLRLAGVVERLSPKVGKALLDGLLKLGPLVAKALAPLGRIVSKAFGRLGKFSRFTVKVLGIQAVIDSLANLAKIIARRFVRMAETVKHAFTGMLNWIIRQVNRVIGLFNKLPGPNIRKLGEVGKSEAPAPAGALGPATAPPGRSRAVARREGGIPQSAPSTPTGTKTKPGPNANPVAAQIQKALRSLGNAIESQSEIPVKRARKLQAQLKAVVDEIANSSLSPAQKQKLKARAQVLRQELKAETSTTNTKTKKAQHFVLPINLQIEQAKAAASGIQAAILAAAKHIRAFLLKVIPKLHGQKLLDAYGLLAQANSEIASVAKDAATKAKDAAQRAKQKMAQAQQAFAQALDNVRSQIGELFQGPILNPTEADQKRQLGVPGPKAKDLTRDVRAQTALFKRFNRDLAILQKRGAPKELIKELRAKGPADLPEIEALAKASKSALHAFLKAFNARERFVRKVAKVELRAEHVNISAAHLTVSTGHERGGRAGRKHKIPAMARGGVVRSPTIALIGEAGPERIEPLGRESGQTILQAPPVYIDGQDVTDHVRTRMQRGAKQTVAQRRGRFAGQITALS